jgi:hypothetical protein
MGSPRDFKDREKIEQLAESLDAHNIPMIRFRVRHFSKKEIDLASNPPKTYSEVAKNMKHKFFKRIFDSQKGPLVKDLYKQ